MASKYALNLTPMPEGSIQFKIKTTAQRLPPEARTKYLRLDPAMFFVDLVLFSCFLAAVENQQLQATAETQKRQKPLFFVFVDKLFL